jgi:hypothetical protein
MWVGAWVGANAAYMAVKLITVVAYATTVNYRVLRAVPKLQSLEYGSEEIARLSELLQVKEGAVMFLWLIPAPYITLPAWEVQFRKDLRHYTEQHVAVPRERRRHERRHGHRRAVLVGCLRYLPRRAGGSRLLH